jgi:SAM-dependent methyltransferase
MKIAVRADSFIDYLGLWLGLVPIPLFETHISATLTRVIMAGVELEIFEALELTSLPGADIAKRCNTDPVATTLLLDSLVACNYLALTSDRYALNSSSRKWLLRSSPHSLRDKILLQAIEWRWLTHMEDFIRTGVPLDFHATMSGVERDLYHRSMRAIAGIAGREVGWRTPVPRGAQRMLDLGGSHGHFAASICRRHLQLSAKIFDFAEAIEPAAPLLAAEGLAGRVVHEACDVTKAEFGVEQYDLVFMSNLAHHLTESQNRELARKVARALRPRGVFVIQEAVRPSSPEKAGQIGTLLGLYFALQSKPGVTSWALADMRAWQTDAGLTLLRAKRLITAPGWIQQSGYRRI